MSGEAARAIRTHCDAASVARLAAAARLDAGRGGRRAACAAGERRLIAARMHAHAAGGAARDGAGALRASAPPMRDRRRQRMAAPARAARRAIDVRALAAGARDRRAASCRTRAGRHARAGGVDAGASTRGARARAGARAGARACASACAPWAPRRARAVVQRGAPPRAPASRDRVDHGASWWTRRGEAARGRRADRALAARAAMTARSRARRLARASAAQPIAMRRC
ncbi:MAG: hypothetical protein WDW36_003383 [Sanguina aurantia]